MGETIAVLFIFFILLIFGLVFYVRIHGGVVEQNVEARTELDAIDIAQKVSYMPEIMCTSKNVAMFETNCVDKYKLEAFHRMLYGLDPLGPEDDNGALQLSYFDMLGYSKIYVNQLYPEDPANPLTYTIYEKTMPEGEMKNQISTWIPVSIYYPIGDEGPEEVAFGVLVVEVFS